MPGMRAIDFDMWMEAAVGEVLESMCFLSTVGQRSDELGGEDWIACRLHFVGDPNGGFGVQAPEATSRLIAANFLGEDEQDLSSQQVIEVMFEISNMMCGVILGQLNPKRTFSLSSPVQDSRMSAPELVSDFCTDRVCRTYSLDEGMLHAWFEVEAGA